MILLLAQNDPACSIMPAGVVGGIRETRIEREVGRDEGKGKKMKVEEGRESAREMGGRGRCLYRSVAAAGVDILMGSASRRRQTRIGRAKPETVTLNRKWRR